MREKRTICAVMIAVLGGASLTGCQSTEQSAYNAAVTCNAAGLRPGTRAFSRCSNVAYAQNRAQSDQATAAAATGLAVGVLGGAVAGAALSRPYYGGYGYGYGYRPYYGGYYGGGYWGGGYRPWGYY